MAIKIIDNKKIDLSNDEWKAYEDICKSYDDPPAVKGRDLFSGLFETDDDGIIVFLKTTKRVCTMEVYLFLVNVMVHQHLRLCYKMVGDATKRLDDALLKLDEKPKVKSKV
jgi:hypothetical protein